jgi:hypothetical protein
MLIRLWKPQTDAYRKRSQYEIEGVKYFLEHSNIIQKLNRNECMTMLFPLWILEKEYPNHHKTFSYKISEGQ